MVPRRMVVKMRVGPVISWSQAFTVETTASGLGPEHTPAVRLSASKSQDYSHLPKVWPIISRWPRGLSSLSCTSPRHLCRTTQLISPRGISLYTGEYPWGDLIVDCHDHQCGYRINLAGDNRTVQFGLGRTAKYSTSCPSRGWNGEVA